MSLVVLDTTVASFMYAGRPELALYADVLLGSTPALPFQAKAEMLLGAELRGWGRSRRAALDTFLAAHMILLVSEAVVAAWVRIMSASERAGRALCDSDAWIAACALANGAPLLTHDADFRGLAIPGLDVVCRAP